jgi:hypothetical protein
MLSDDNVIKLEMNNQRVYGLRGVAQALKHLPSKAKALSSNSIPLKIGFLKNPQTFYKHYLCDR